VVGGTCLAKPTTDAKGMVPAPASHRKSFRILVFPGHGGASQRGAGGKKAFPVTGGPGLERGPGNPTAPQKKTPSALLRWGADKNLGAQKIPKKHFFQKKKKFSPKPHVEFGPGKIHSSKLGGGAQPHYCPSAPCGGARVSGKGVGGAPAV